MYQQGFSHGTSYSGPPPAKKPKSNPIITKYPPPPGYRPPPQAQPSFQPPGYGHPSYPGYQQQPYGAPQHYQPQWPGYQPPPYVQPGYQPPQFHYPPPNSVFPVPHSGWQNPASAPTGAPTQPWQASSTGFNQNKRRHNSAPFPHARNVSLGPLDGNGDPLPPQQPSVAGADDLEEDFDAECYFSRHPDEIDSALSLGLIEWQAPLPTKMALPSTFAEAELEALAPRKPRAFDDESISDYFTKEKREEALLSVRQTEAWDEVKDDVIFRDFPLVCSKILTMFELVEGYRDRPDPDWTAPPLVEAASQTPDPTKQGVQIKAEPNGDAMETDQSHDASAYIKSEDAAEQNDVLGNLEQALFANDTNSSMNGYQPGASHSRTASTSSTTGERLTRPKPLAPVRDRAQEDILASLGVTGSPKMVYQTPGPAFGAPPPQQDGGTAPGSRHNSVSSNTGTLRPPLPPNGHAIARPGSATSQHTAAGSDFHTEDMDATPRPRHDRMDGRKRSHGDLENGNRGDPAWDTDDITPRQQRYKQARTDGAYGRRW